MEATPRKQDPWHKVDKLGWKCMVQGHLEYGNLLYENIRANIGKFWGSQAWLTAACAKHDEAPLLQASEWSWVFRWSKMPGLCIRNLPSDVAFQKSGWFYCNMSIHFIACPSKLWRFVWLSNLILGLRFGGTFATFLSFQWTSLDSFRLWSSPRAPPWAPLQRTAGKASPAIGTRLMHMPITSGSQTWLAGNSPNWMEVAS